jgi:hypothetical protein
LKTLSSNGTGSTEFASSVCPGASVAVVWLRLQATVRQQARIAQRIWFRMPPSYRNFTTEPMGEISILRRRCHDRGFARIPYADLSEKEFWRIPLLKKFVGATSTRLNQRLINQPLDNLTCIDTFTLGSECRDQPMRQNGFGNGLDIFQANHVLPI